MVPLGTNPSSCRLTTYASSHIFQPTRKGQNMKAIGYIRVSTVGQAVDGVSLEAQQAKITAWCLSNDSELAGVFVDAGISGKRSDNRPQLQAALDAVCKSKGVLVVYSLSRLARSTKDTIGISERLEKSGADLVSLSEKLDTTSAAGKMVFRLMAVLAEFERDQISERTRCGLAFKRSQGKRVSRKIPFGFDLAADGDTLIENAQEQSALTMIQELRTTGLTLRAIAAELTTRGIKTKEGHSEWQHSMVGKLLSRAA